MRAYVYCASGYGEHVGTVDGRGQGKRGQGTWAWRRVHLRKDQGAVTSRADRGKLTARTIRDLSANPTCAEPCGTARYFYREPLHCRYTHYPRPTSAPGLATGPQPRVRSCSHALLCDSGTCSRVIRGTNGYSAHCSDAARSIGRLCSRGGVQPRGEVLLKGKSMPTKLFVPSYRPFRVAIKY